MRQHKDSDPTQEMKRRWRDLRNWKDWGGERKKGRQGRNQYFCNVATPATSNDSKHHEKIWEQGKGKK